MASSFINYNQKGFWAYDTLIEPLCGVFFIVINERNYKDEWQLKFKKLMLKNTIGSFSSYMHFNFDEYITSEIHRNWFLELLKFARDLFISKGDVINFNFIGLYILPEQHYVEGNWDFEIKTYRMLKLIDYLELLLNSKLDVNEKDKIFYEF